MNYPKVCPNCGSNLKCIYHEKNDSYYLQCKDHGYDCWHKNCPKEFYNQYEHEVKATPISSYEQEVLDGMLQADEDTDYYHHWR